MAASERLAARIPTSLAGLRLDQALAAMWPEYSRSRLTQWIREQQVRVNQDVWRPRDRVQGGEMVEIRAHVEPQESWRPQDLPLNVLHEDDDLLVLDKAPGRVVHPAAGNRDGTLLNALIHHHPPLAGIPRAGIVHRLDKDTSGLMVVAKNLSAHRALVEQIRSRAVAREYLAVVNGVVTAGGRVEAPVGRHPTQRVRMAVVARGKPAATRYRVLERFPGHTLLHLTLETGRTHQIRVHMAHIRHPIVGDPLYGGRPRLPPGSSDSLASTLRTFRRQALHAWRLRLVHPHSGEQLSFEAPPPPDLARLLEALREEGGRLART